MIAEDASKPYDGRKKSIKHIKDWTIISLK
jgi:hypothetical protein